VNLETGDPRLWTWRLAVCVLLSSLLRVGKNRTEIQGPGDPLVNRSFTYCLSAYTAVCVLQNFTYSPSPFHKNPEFTPADACILIIIYYRIQVLKKIALSKITGKCNNIYV